MRGLITPPAGRLLAATITLLIALAAASWLILANAARGYSDELTQRLNRDIAMYVVAEGPLIRRGRVDDGQLTRLARQAMVINPMAEVYLLDPAGKIIGHRIKAPLAAITVDLAPVRAFLQQPSSAPIYGTDPRDAADRRVFSAAEIRQGEQLEGYVYVVLGGVASKTTATPIAGSYILRAALITLLVVLLLAAAAAYALTAWLTRPVRDLHARVLQLGAQPGDAASAEVGGAGDQTHIVDLQSVRNAIEALATRLAEQVEELKQADRLRRDLYASVSHDLRTPLTAMRGYLDTLANEDQRLSPEHRRSYVEIAVRHCERLTRLVDQVFSLARLDATTVRLRPESVAATELAQDVVTKLQCLAERAGVHLRLEVDPHAPPVVADIGMLETVLQNLIDNALRHTAAGGEVVVSVKRREEAVEILVRDTGCGMSPSEIERMTRPNEIGAGGRTGLGLAIVKRVLDLHGTELHLTSAVGIGTTAVFLMTTNSALSDHANDSPAGNREEVVTFER